MFDLYARPADFIDPIEALRHDDNPLESLRGLLLGAGRRWSLEQWAQLGEVLYDLDCEVATAYVLDHARRLGRQRWEAVEGGLNHAESCDRDPDY